MKLVAFLLLIQMGYITAKAIENPRPCNGTSKNDPRLKRSDEKEIFTDLADTMEQHPDDLAGRQTYSKPTIGNGNKGYQNTYDFALNPNTLPQKLPLVNNVNVSANGKGNTILNNLTTTNAPQQKPIFYQAIDPKSLIVSGLYLYKSNNITNTIAVTEKTVTDFNETTQLSLESSNLTKLINDLNKTKATDTERKELVINDFDIDVTNIRELREHLLDHLLDYFLNIIKEENFIRNDTRKNNGKEKMKVEDKLRNYYGSRDLDLILVDDDNEDYNLDTSDYQSNIDSEEDLVDNLKHNDINNITNIDPLSTLEIETEKNPHKVYKSTENDKIQKLNLEENLSSSDVDVESLYVNLSEPVTTKYDNLVEKQNNSSNTLSNTIEKSKNAFDSNINVIITTESTNSNEALSEDTGPLIYSDEAITNRKEFDYGISAHTVKDDSYEDFSGSYELQVVKNITVHEEDKHPIVSTTENGRRKNEVNKEKYTESGTLKYIKNKQILKNNTTDFASTDKEKDETPNDFGILHLSNENVDEVSSENYLPDIINKTSTNKSRAGMKRKLKSEKTCGKLVTKLIKKRKSTQICRKSITFNFNLNLF